MFKRLFAVAAVFIFFAAALPAFAGQLFNAQTAINDALNNLSQYYEQQNKQGKSINYVSIPILSNYLKGDSYYGCLVYGSPQDVPGNDLKGGQYRYLGYTFEGEDYTNVAFPPDVGHSGYFEDQQWIREPWQNGDVTTNYNIDFNNSLDGTDRYAQNIRHGILVYYSDSGNTNNYQLRGINSTTQDFWDNIHQRVHILAPPTDLAYGIGRMWRVEGGNIFYVTVPLLPNSLLPEPVNLKVNSITLNPDTVDPGQLVSGTISVTNNSKEAFTATKTFWAVRRPDGSELVSNTIVVDMGASETKILPFSFTPDVAGQYSVATMINPDHSNPPNEVNFLSGDWPGDNRVEVSYSVRSKDYDINVQIIQGNPYGTYTLSTSDNPAEIFCHARVTRKDNLPETLPVRLTMSGDGGTVVEEFDLGPGGDYTYEMYTIEAYDSGDYYIEAQAWPSDGSWEDIYPPDNVDSMTIQYIYIELPELQDSGIRVDIIDSEMY